VAQLRSRYGEIQALNTGVVIISFSPAHRVRLWQKETGAPFLILRDPARKGYKAYGLERSLRRSWGLKTFWRYAKLLFSGYRWRGIQGDSGQLGGDFLVDSQGVLRLVHPSRNPTDRPTVDAIIAELRRLSA